MSPLRVYGLNRVDRFTWAQGKLERRSSSWFSVRLQTATLRRPIDRSRRDRVAGVCRGAVIYGFVSDAGQSLACKLGCVTGISK